MARSDDMLVRLEALHADPEAWEAMCDGCGRCCQFQEHHAGKWHDTGIACRFLNIHECRCTEYANRFSVQPLCKNTTPEFLVESMEAWPATCSYLAHARGEDLPWWHHLVSGSRDTVHEAGISARGRLRSETWVRWEHERARAQAPR